MAATDPPLVGETDAKEIPVQYRKFAKLFEDPQDLRALPEHKPWDHEINFKEGFVPPAEKLRPHNPSTLRVWEEYRSKAEKKGWIRKSKSPCAANVLLAFKKGDPNGRPCGDYRRVNDETIRDVYPIPKAQELRDRLSKAVIYTKLDQRNAFNLIRIKEGHEWKTAFILPSGLWEYTVMPFGLTNAPATCQRQNNEILKEFSSFVICYLDDILVFSQKVEEHEGHVIKVLEAFRKVDSRLKLSKCEFSVKKVTFLGYVVEPGQMSIDPEKTEKVRNWERPRNVKDVQTILGFANFCRVFIKDFSKMVEPLTEMTKKGMGFAWNERAEQAFQEIKDRFTREPILYNYHDDRESIIETDASDTCVAGVHLQRDDNGKLHLVAYYSSKMDKTEQNYNIYEKELIAIVKSLKH
ncbi:hypothetical protein sscle_06g051980 [Sclerotinia sclerotiorum 1980 UF-70]|uniref:Reverse transcriptase domain-containing protein n=1 Tax=Sclerotinia sclerotiorum (strain ATCC 18683 / 1980 / Ss-1) TaxID=665079 RepID=A0A1D9Q653_SCLS1|nr:hypothetical protein sscle_06g051980 [Sclerotinia sclerotiorum 1980 UF-70]